MGRFPRLGGGKTAAMAETEWRRISCSCLRQKVVSRICVATNHALASVAYKTPTP
ncbi:hypothetical protein [Novipirellula caenicola]|uniref:hypothetical protein n=1 Tax=Novipirellula caenicola TaxID=1536901 RepID=UPI0031F15D82